MIDGEACAHCPEGLPDFHSLRGEEGGANACLFAFDLLWHDGRDLRRLPLEERRARLRVQLRRARPSLRVVDFLEGDGSKVFAHACRLGLEGIVSKRRDLGYRSGRSAAWLKIRTRASEKKLAGAVMTSFIKKCERDAARRVGQR